MKILVVTRPIGQDKALNDELRSLGHEVRHLPLLRIEPKSNSLPQANADWIFISVNAVKNTYQNATNTEWQDIINSKVYAIGSTTQAELIQLGVTEVMVPNSSNSESLLELETLQAPLNRSIVLACGIDGRRLIEQELSKRGASVLRYESYQRLDCEVTIFKEFCATIPLRDSIWIVSSEQVLRYLNNQSAHTLSCIVTSERLETIALELSNINAIAVSDGAQNSNIVSCVKTLNSKANK